MIAPCNHASPSFYPTVMHECEEIAVCGIIQTLLFCSKKKRCVDGLRYVV